MFSSSASQVSSTANFIEDVFQTWLYTGNGSTQTINNGIDLTGKGGLVWIKGRGTDNHMVFDTVRGANKRLNTNTTADAFTGTDMLTSFGASGFSLGADTDSLAVNASGDNYVSWTFRKQTKFFDVVTWTGDGQTFRTVNHNLGSMPGFIICKCTSTTSDWSVLAKMSSGSSDFIPLNLNTTASSRYGGGITAAVSSTLFYTADLGFDGSSDSQLRYNQNGQTYVAYLFASNAGGFGPTGSDNVISCGSFVGAASVTVNLGYEPQWILYKRTTGTGAWCLYDTMRGLTASNISNQLNPNSSAAEVAATSVNGGIVTPTGFDINADTAFNAYGETFIYIAIRRGPMKVPTTGTSVFAPVARSGTSGTATITAGFAPDVIWSQVRNYSQDDGTFDKLRGAVNLRRTSTGAEYAAANAVTAYTNTGVTVGVDSDTGAINSSGGNYGNWIFQRAPGFFDEVCYTGTFGPQTLTHNLGVVPEMFILKNRAGGTDGNWIVYHAAVGNTAALQLNLTAAPATTSVYFANTSPTSTVFTVGTNQSSSGGTYVAYLFASCPGVSKVGSYTGNGSNQTINCGFTGGARFVMIKRTDSTGDWYVWDTARGIVSGNDPRLSLNSTAAEVTTDDSVDTDSTGFVVNQLSATNINVTSATYIFLSIS